MSHALFSGSSASVDGIWHATGCASFCILAIFAVITAFFARIDGLSFAWVSFKALAVASFDCSCSSNSLAAHRTKAAAATLGDGPSTTRILVCC